MRLFRHSALVVAGILSAGCSADLTTGPRPEPRFLSGEADAAKSLANGAKIYCNGSSCIAAAFDSTDYPEYTLFTATLQNLQGTYPSSAPATTQRLNWFKFEFFDEDISDDYVIADPAFRSFVTIGNVEVGFHNLWSNDSNIFGPLWETFSTTGYGITGCDLTSDLDPRLDFHFRTCPRDGFDGWVAVGFKLRRAGPVPRKARVRLHDFRFSFGNASAFCSVGGKEKGACEEIPYNRAMKDFGT